MASSFHAPASSGGHCHPANVLRSLRLPGRACVAGLLGPAASPLANTDTHMAMHARMLRLPCPLHTTNRHQCLVTCVKCIPGQGRPPAASVPHTHHRAPVYLKISERSCRNSASYLLGSLRSSSCARARHPRDGLDHASARSQSIRMLQSARAQPTRPALT